MKQIFLWLLLISLSFSKEILLFSPLDEKEFLEQDLNQYLMSEKLDGVRGIWNGKEFKTRKNHPIHTPAFFTQNFPPFKLDGELFIKRNDFDNISALVRSNEPSNPLWKSVTYNVFDVPKACKMLEICTLENRLKVLENYLKTNPNPYIKIIPQIPIQSKAHLENFYQEILKQKGEGIIVRKNALDYENKRSIFALKLKPFTDAECEVIGYTQGKGKFQNKVGALLCKTPKGQIIKIGSGLKNKDRENPPEIGTIISYKFSGFTKNQLPRFPVFLRIRE